MDCHEILLSGEIDVGQFNIVGHGWGILVTSHVKSCSEVGVVAVLAWVGGSVYRKQDVDNSSYYIDPDVHSNL